MKIYIKANGDYTALVGQDFKTVRDYLTKQGFHETEYGDTTNGDGYAVYRNNSPDGSIIEYEVIYEWVERSGKKNSYRAGRVIDIKKDSFDDIQGSRSIKSNYGYDMNGDEIDESTVEALYRIAEREILPDTMIGQLGECTIDEDSFKYFATGTAFGAYLKYTIILDLSDNEIDVYSFSRGVVGETLPALNDNGNYIQFEFYISVDGEKIDVTPNQIDVYQNDTYSDYFSDKFAKGFDVPAICDMIKEIAEPAVRDIHATLSNV